jgi:hypothetical protein
MPRAPILADDDLLSVALIYLFVVFVNVETSTVRFTRISQIGFSKGSRTSDHMFVLKTLIDKYTQQGSKHLYTCFVDFCSFSTKG